MALMDSKWDDAALAAQLSDPNRGEAGAEALLLVQVAPNTGTGPVLFAASDNHRYWAKWPDNPHGPFSMANEWVVSQLAEHLEAPVPPAMLLGVHPGLVQGRSHNGQRLPGGTWFGSQLVPGLESGSLELAHRDGNPSRIPRFLALWHLCFGVDQQHVYDKIDQDRVYSIDHGMWFDCGGGDWDPRLLERTDQLWPEPQWSGPPRADPAAFHAAAAAVEGLGCEAIGSAVGSVPVGWGVPDAELALLAQFLHGRRAYVAEHLRLLATRTRGVTK